jgi:hypothetical protein
MILAGVNEALRSSRSLMESKTSGLIQADSAGSAASGRRWSSAEERALLLP